MIVLLDNGHGVNTRGKGSPDGRLREYRWTREMATMVESALKAKGVNVRRLVPEDTDISLTERVHRVNAECERVGAKNVLLVSIHNNAAGNDARWHNASGFTAWVYTGASDASKRLAVTFQALAEAAGLKGNRAVPACKYYTAAFYILKHTLCPAVLTENLFQDNHADVDFLLSEEGKLTLCDLHVDAICKYLGL